MTLPRCRDRSGSLSNEEAGFSEGWFHQYIYTARKTMEKMTRWLSPSKAGPSPPKRSDQTPTQPKIQPSPEPSTKQPLGIVQGLIAAVGTYWPQLSTIPIHPAMHVSSIETQAPSIQKPETDIWIPPKNTILAKQPLIDVKSFFVFHSTIWNVQFPDSKACISISNPHVLHLFPELPGKKSRLSICETTPDFCCQTGSIEHNPSGWTLQTQNT